MLMLSYSKLVSSPHWVEVREENGTVCKKCFIQPKPLFKFQHLFPTFAQTQPRGQWQAFYISVFDGAVFQTGCVAWLSQEVLW